MAFWNRKKAHYPEEQLELHKTALELKGISINLQRTVDQLAAYMAENKQEVEEEKNGQSG